jgi:hypothetical protein
MVIQAEYSNSLLAGGAAFCFSLPPLRETA